VPTRREFSKCLLGTGAALWSSGSLSPSNRPLLASDLRVNQSYDLLIKGGTVIDPARNLHTQLDVAVKDGKIAGLSVNIPPNGFKKIISAKGKLVTPGLIDIHVHVYEGVTESGLNADRSCLAHGVTTAVDAGSAGYPSISGFRKYIIDSSNTRLFALVDIGALGTLVGVKDTMKNLEWVNPQLTAKAANKNKPSVVGIKARLSKDIAGTLDLEGLKRAREAAEDSNLPMMLHIGDTYHPLKDILGVMRPGDIITHCFTPRPHGIVDQNGKVLPEVWEARQRGILFDVGHGTFHFSFDLAEECIRQGFLPDTISSDLAGRNVNGPVFDLTTVLSKFLLLGLTVDKVIELATIRPAHSFKFCVPLGTLEPGSPADISILELKTGTFVFTDCAGKKRNGSHKLVGTASIRDGKLFEPSGEFGRRVNKLRANTTSCGE